MTTATISRTLKIRPSNKAHDKWCAVKMEHIYRDFVDENDLPQNRCTCNYNTGEGVTHHMKCHLRQWPEWFADLWRTKQAGVGCTCEYINTQGTTHRNDCSFRYTPRGNRCTCNQFQAPFIEFFDIDA